jgi:autotransporter-associated beta strand protein
LLSTAAIYVLTSGIHGMSGAGTFNYFFDNATTSLVSSLGAMINTGLTGAVTLTQTSNGTGRIQSVSATGTASFGTATVNIGANTQVVYDGTVGTVPNSFLLAGNGLQDATGFSGALRAANGYIFTGGITIAAGGAQIDALGDSATVAAATFNGVISGGPLTLGSVSFPNLETLTLGNAANTYSTTTIPTGTTVVFGASGSVGTGTVTDNGTLNLNGVSRSLPSLAGSGVVQDAAAAPATLTVGGDNASTTFTGTIKDGAGGGALSLDKVGTGTFTLGSSATYSGDTTISAGTLHLGPAATVSTSSISGAGTLSLDVTGGAYGSISAGTVDVTGITLQINASSLPTLIPFGTTYTIVNDTGAGTDGNFNGLPEGATVAVGGTNFTISYVGGDGNDITLTRIPAAGHVFYADASTTGDETDADPVAPGNQPGTFGVNLFSSVNQAIAAALSASSTNDDDASRYTVVVNAGSYNEDVSIPADIGMIVQSGPVAFNSLADTVSTATLDIAGVQLTIGSDSNSTTFASQIAGNGSINMVGSGTFALNGANVWGGGLTLNSGQIDVDTPTALGTGILTINGGVLDNVSGSAVTEINNNPEIWNGNFTFLGSSSLNLGTGNVTLGTTPTITANSGTLTVGGAISGPFGITFVGPSILSLGGNSSYTGVTTISGGTLLVTNSNGLGSTGTASGTVVSGGASLQLQGGISIGAEPLSLNGIGPSGSGALESVSGTNTYAGLITLAGPARIDADSGALVLSNTGAITGPGFMLSVGGAGNVTLNGPLNTTTAGSLLKDGTGTLTMTAASNFTGGTTISAGTLATNGNDLLTSGAVSIGAAGTLLLNNNETIGALTGSGNVSLQGNILTTSGTGTFTGTFTGTTASGIAIAGGTLTLADPVPSASTYGVVNIVNTGGGGLVLGATEQIPNNATVTLNGAGTGTNGATFNLATFTETVATVNVVNSSTNTNGLSTGMNGHLIVTGTLSISGGEIVFNSGNPGSSITANSVIDTGGTWVFGTGSGGLQQLIVGPGGITIGNGATLPVDGNATINQIVLNGDITSNAAANIDTFTGGAAKTGKLVLSGGHNINVADGAAAVDLSLGLNLVDGTSPGSITKTGPGTLVLPANGAGTVNSTILNTYTGGTTVDGGTLTVFSNLGATTGPLVVSNPNTGPGSAVVLNLSPTTPTTVGDLSGSIAMPSSGANTATINTSGPLFTVDQTTAETYAGVIAGGSDVTFNGAPSAALTLTGTNTYTGATTVSAGDLFVNGSLSNSSTVSIAAGATLGGAGTVGSVMNAGTIDPGSAGSSGTLSVGNLTLGPGALSLDLSNFGTSDSVVASGTTVDITGSMLSLNVGTVTANETFTILSAPNATITGTFTNLPDSSSTMTVGSVTFGITYSANLIVLTALNSGGNATLVGGPVLNSGIAYINSPLATQQHSMVENVVYSFSSAVSLSAANFTLSGFQGTPASLVPNVNVSPSAGGTVWTVTFSGNGVNAATHSIGDGEYELVLSGVPGLASNTFDFFRLLGDMDGNGTVNTSDFATLISTFLRATTDPLYLGADDFDGDGTIGTSDFAQFTANFLKSVPTPLPN